MINREMRKLNRRELVDIIYQMKKNEQLMQEEIASLQKSLQDRRMRLSEVGSVAEAAVDITQVLLSAQETADIYLHEIRCMRADTENECVTMLEDTKKRVKDLLLYGAEMFASLNTCYIEEYKKLQMLREEIKELERQKKI